MKILRKGETLNKKIVITSVTIFVILCLEKVLQFYNILRYPSLGFVNEYVIEWILIFISNYFYTIVLLFCLVFLILNVRKYKLSASLPLIISFLTIWLLSSFNLFNVYSSNKFALNYPKYEKVIDLVRKNKLQFVEEYAEPRGAYWNEYKYYGDMTNYIYKLPYQYGYLSSDYSNKPNICVLKSKKIGIVQVEFYISGSRFAYIYSPYNKVYKGDCTMESIAKKKTNWFYVVWE